MNFNYYLKKQELSTKTITSFEMSVNRFLVWLKKQAIEPAQVSYSDMLAYMKYCQKKGTTQRTLQSYINAVKHFFDYLIEEKQIEINPVTRIKIQGVKRKVLYHIFELHELHAICNSFEVNTITDKRDKVMLGLLVYQGLKTEELGRLEVKDIKLKEGKIEIAGSRKSNARILQMESHQVLEMYEYILQVRKEILVQANVQT